MVKVIYVVFGITGDLAKRKLIPSFFHLNKNKQISEDFEVLGIGRKEINKKDFQNGVYSALKEFGEINQKDVSKKFIDKISYRQIDFGNLEDYISLKKELEKNKQGCKIIFYLAMPPKLFFPILENIKNAKLNFLEKEEIKIAFEKPFGGDLDSAVKLNSAINEVFDESQVYRIDHYLGKEAVMNFLVLRFANFFFEPMWNSKYIDNVQIIASEKIGVGLRASYYDSAGALRDMIQNHLFQMLSLIAMEAPVSLDSELIRDEKHKVFKSIKEFEGSSWNENVVFGQYDGYLNEKGIDKKSRTETFVALKVKIDNWRWAGVPFYLKTGKSLKEKGTLVVIEFKKLPGILFNKDEKLESNKLIIKIQPDERIKLELNIKSENNEILPVYATFDNKEFFGVGSPEAYQKILSDIEKGDHTLFPRWDSVYESWKIIDKLVNCRENCPLIFKYKQGTWGPKEADELLESSGNKWNHI